MPLLRGGQLGPYVVEEPLGAGGMGEVYRARDTRLKRDVAIKILPESFASDPDRLARFQREAEVLASLSHPNIAGIYGLEESDGIRALVMELVEGETLAHRIARGPIPIDEALPIAKQVAEALEAAHEQGVIHRDLKPANIKIRPDGTVKVLDFGLAKLTESTEVGTTNSPSLSMSPTITSPALISGVGVLLGTAAYMSPEQAKGKPADKRSDIWAFGCVLYEMLTGTRAFEGDDVADTLAAVLRGEPDWNRLPKTTPPAIRRVLRRCLAKERTRRLSAIDAVRLDLEEPPGEDVTRRVSVPPYQRAWVWASLAAIAVIAAVASWATRPSAQPLPSVTFAIPAPPDTTFANGPFSLSPDGKSVAFIASGPDRTPRIWIRSLASLDARAIGGTEGAGIDSASGGNIRVLRMVWSPDSRALAFVQQGRLRKIELATGGAQTLCDSCGEPGSWGRDGIILISGPFTNGSILRLPASGGSITAVAVPNRSGTRASQYQFPSLLPDGKHFVFIRTMSDSWTMFIGSVDNPPDRQESLMLRAVTGQTPIAYVGDETGRSGHLLFMQDDTLVAQAFDTDALAFTGDPVPVVESVGRAGGGTAFFAASSNGLLAFRNGSADRVFIWYGTDGKRLRSLDAIRPYTRAEVQLSPDGTQLITTGPFPSLSSWIIDVNRGLRTRIAPDGVNAHAVWSRDGARIAYSAPSAGKWALSLKPSNGSTTEKVVWQTDTEVVPNDWSSDGRYLLYSSYDAKTKWDLWVLAVDGKQPPMPVARTTSTEVRGQFSPDQRWIAYESDESGERQIHVKPFVTDRSADDRHWTIDAGAQVRWSRDGKRLFYRRSDAILSVDVTSNDFRNGAAKTLFSVYGPGPGDTQNAYYDVSADGQRFIVTSFPEQNLTAPITVLLNWRGLLAP